MRVVMAMGAAAVLALSLNGCGGPTSAVVGKDQTARQASVDPRDAPVPMVNGKPMWAANRRHTAEENAQFQFTKNGGDFGAKSEADYVAQAHAFVDQPGSGVETLDRPNGDRLIYDAKANVFAVVSKAGAPRTMFKPRAGAAYWAQQKDRQAKDAKAGSSQDS
jgi:pyocin large subunit-like protein